MDNSGTIMAFYISLANQNIPVTVTTNLSLNLVINHNDQTGRGGPPLSVLLNSLGLLITLCRRVLKILSLIKLTSALTPLLFRCNSSFASLDMPAESRLVCLSKNLKNPSTKITFRSH